MKILYIEWNSLCAADVKSALKALGHEVKTISTPDKNKFELNEDFQFAVEQAIKAYKPDFVFSMNFSLVYLWHAIPAIPNIFRGFMIIPRQLLMIIR